MNVATKLWETSLKMVPDSGSVVTPALRYADTITESYSAEAVVNTYHRVLERAISIVAGQPFMKDARRDGDTFHHLDIGYGTAVLTWCRRGKIDVARIPSFLLDLDMDALAKWQASQVPMIAAVMSKAAE